MASNKRNHFDDGVSCCYEAFQCKEMEKTLLEDTYDAKMYSQDKKLWNMKRKFRYCVKYIW